MIECFHYDGNYPSLSALLQRPIVMDDYNTKKKLINDPVYGFFQIPHGLLYNIIEHPYFQRLRRIRQLGLSDMVYPGALHTRFHHALGACYLSISAIQTLRNKGVEITTEEAVATAAAVLLHDIGHGPFSHTLEQTLLPVHHENLSDWIIEQLNAELNGELELAAAIFRGTYSKTFLHELVSSQLDVDRMDYLNRDSYFTGVSEGVIGYHRLIKMLNVVDNNLVVEEKGIYSIEKFLMARRLMYWQVYLHKTSLCAEVMLKHILARARYLVQHGKPPECSGTLRWFLHEAPSSEDFENNRDRWLQRFTELDDVDILYAVKLWVNNPDPVLNMLASGIIHRKLFRIIMQPQPFENSLVDAVSRQLSGFFPKEKYPLEWLLFRGSESNQSYNSKVNEIKILLKNGEVIPFSSLTESAPPVNLAKRFYLCFPKI